MLLTLVSYMYMNMFAKSVHKMCSKYLFRISNSLISSSLFTQIIRARWAIPSMVMIWVGCASTPRRIGKGGNFILSRNMTYQMKYIPHSFPIHIIRQMQFHPHSTYVISGWYENQDFLEIDTAQGAQTVKMMGVGEYDLQAEPRKKIAIKVLTSVGAPQYIGFNSSKRANFQNDEADNQVTIIEKTGDRYGVSNLKKYLVQGESFDLNGKIVSAECINTSVTPSLACVCVREIDQTCPTDCACSDIVEPTPPPTPAVSMT